jgi:hypothetical protein
LKDLTTYSSQFAAISTSGADQLFIIAKSSTPWLPAIIALFVCLSSYLSLESRDAWDSDREVISQNCTSDRDAQRSRSTSTSAVAKNLIIDLKLGVCYVAVKF